jgi:hypothetical protein
LFNRFNEFVILVKAGVGIFGPLDDDTCDAQFFEFVDLLRICVFQFRQRAFLPPVDSSNRMEGEWSGGYAPSSRGWGAALGSRQNDHDGAQEHHPPQNPEGDEKEPAQPHPEWVIRVFHELLFGQPHERRLELACDVI